MVLFIQKIKESPLVVINGHIKTHKKISRSGSILAPICLLYNKEQKGFIMSGDTKRVLEVNQIDNLQGSTQRVKQETTLNNLRGITQRVYVVGGGTPVIDELNVTPSTSAQTITAPEGVDGYSPVNVSAVTSAIDANITAGNIKKDVEILGVTGSYEGQTPTGTMYIISNGTYNVADKAIANVNVPTTAPTRYFAFDVSSGGSLKYSTTMPVMSFTGVKYINIPFETVYANNTNVGSVDMSSVLQLSKTCLSMFSGSTITSIDLSSIQTLSVANGYNYMFNNCQHLVSVNLNSLQQISGYQACAYMFRASSITTMSFPALYQLTTGGLYYAFQSCTSLTDVYFGGLKSTGSMSSDCFSGMLDGTTGVTLHFPSNLDPQGGSTKISSLSGYPTFGGTNTVLSFDLPATS